MKINKQIIHYNWKLQTWRYNPRRNPNIYRSFLPFGLDYPAPNQPKKKKKSIFLRSPTHSRRTVADADADAVADRRWCTWPYTGARTWLCWSTHGGPIPGRVTSSLYSPASSSPPSTSSWRIGVSDSNPPSPPIDLRRRSTRRSSSSSAPARVAQLRREPPRPCYSGSTRR